MDDKGNIERFTGKLESISEAERRFRCLFAWTPQHIRANRSTLRSIARASVGSFTALPEAIIEGFIAEADPRMKDGDFQLYRLNGQK